MPLQKIVEREREREREREMCLVQYMFMLFYVITTLFVQEYTHKYLVLLTTCSNSKSGVSHPPPKIYPFRTYACTQMEQTNAGRESIAINIHK